VVPGIGLLDLLDRARWLPSPRVDCAHPDPGADGPSPAASDIGDMLGGGMVLTLGSFAVILGLDSTTGTPYGGIGFQQSVMLRHSGRPTLILVLVGIKLAGESNAALVVNHLCWESFHLLEPRTTSSWS